MTLEMKIIYKKYQIAQLHVSLVIFRKILHKCLRLRQALNKKLGLIGGKLKEEMIKIYWQLQKMET